MLNVVYNVVPNDAKRLERINRGWVLRYGFTPAEHQGHSKCVERFLSQTRRPKLEVIRRIVEGDGYKFNEDDYKE